MRALNPAYRQEAIAKQREGTLWTPLTLSPLLGFLYLYFTDQLDQPLDRNFFIFWFIWSSYPVIWFVVHRAVPLLSYNGASWCTFAGNPIIYIFCVLLSAANAAFMGFVAFSK